MKMTEIARHVGIAEGSVDAICSGMPRRPPRATKATPEVVATWREARAAGATYAAIAARAGVATKTVVKYVQDGRCAPRRGQQVASEIRAAYASGVTGLELVERFQLSHHTIKRIVGAEHYRSIRVMLSLAEVDAIRHAACADARLAGLVARLERDRKSVV